MLDPCSCERKFPSSDILVSFVHFWSAVVWPCWHFSLRARHPPWARRLRHKPSCSLSERLSEIKITRGRDPKVGREHGQPCPTKSVVNNKSYPRTVLSCVVLFMSLWHLWNRSDGTNLCWKINCITMCCPLILSDAKILIFQSYVQ